MRRSAALLAVIASLGTAACATPPIQLTPVYAIGSQRVYTLQTDSTITLDVPGDHRVERTRLIATSTIEVLGKDGDNARVRLTIRPDRFERDGVLSERPEQQVELIVAPDGSVQQIKSVGGVAADLTADVTDLIPLLGVPLPSERIRLGDHWTRSSPTSEGAPSYRQSGLVAALRVEHGHDAVILRVGTERPLTRERTIGERTIGLSGTEFATSEIAYAFREGFPVRIASNAEGRFSIVSAEAGGGSVTIETESLLQLADVP